MPAVLPVQSSLAGVRVLVSGANGFIALHVVKTLLEQGYIVRGTVRSEEKGRRLEERFREVYGSKFEWIVVEDIAKVRTYYVGRPARGCLPREYLTRSSGWCIR